MGAFCVFGISRQECRAKAERTILPYYMDSEGVRRYFTVTEWGGKVVAEAKRLFETSEKPVRISPEFDAPQFCRDWFAVDPGQVKLASIMVRGPKKDDNGKPVLRNGNQVMTWLPYTVGGQVQQLIASSPREKAAA